MASILLVEDDSSMRHFLSKALERADHRVQVCSDGLEALALVQNEGAAEFDLLLTDIVMPGMDGIQLAQKVGSLHPELKIMFLTGFSAVVMNRKDVTTSVNMLSKPFHLKELVDKIEQLLAG